MKRSSMTTFHGIFTEIMLPIRSLVFQLVIAALIMLRASPATAELVIDITQGNIDPITLIN